MFPSGVLEGPAQFRQGCPHVFGNDFGIGKHRHEVRIAVPARHDVKMDVVVDSRTAGTPEVCTEVETFGAHCCIQRLNGFARRSHDVQQLLIGQLIEARHLTVRHNHHVAAVVRIAIHDDKAMLAAPDDKLFVIVICLQRLKKDTLLRFLPWGVSERFYVRRPPRRPHAFHVRSVLSEPKGYCRRIHRQAKEVWAKKKVGADNSNLVRSVEALERYACSLFLFFSAAAMIFSACSFGTSS